MKIRTTHSTVITTHREAGADVSPPTVVAVAAIAVENPLAGQGSVADLGELEALGAQAAEYLVSACLAVLASAGVGAGEVRGYGKAAIVGTAGDREHSAAILHPRFGAPVRAAIGGGADIIPLPLGNKDDRWVFDDMDAVTVAIPDAPRPDEIVIALALSARGRPNARTRKPT
jgi:hypothetical protein